MKLWDGWSNLEEGIKMKNKVIRIWTYVLGILPLIVLGCLYTRLPEQVPMNWGFNGTVTYGNKVQLWIVFSLGIIMAVMFDVLPKIDPKRANYKRFGKYYDLFALTMIIFLMIMQGVVLVESFKPNTVQVGQLVAIVVGVLFMITGNIMPKIKTNFYMGIRTPWTLSNTDVWNKTHRLGGRLMFLVGALTIICSVFLNSSVTFIIMMVGVVCMATITLVMSYIWYRRL